MNNFFKKLKFSDREAQYLGFVLPEQVENEEGYDRAPITEQQYFEIRLPETFLREERSYWKEYKPLTVGLVRFSRAGSIREYPFVISSEMLLGNLPGDDAGWSEFYDVKALGPFPYEEDDVEIAVALYAVQSRDYAGELFRLTEKLLGKLQNPFASQAVETAELIGDAVGQLIGLDKVTRKLGFYQNFQCSEGAPNCFRDQYLLKINSGVSDIDSKSLRIKDGRVNIMSEDGHLARASSWDFCLTRISASDKTVYKKLPFYKTWLELDRLISEGSKRANLLYLELIRQITTCPDLTENDRLHIPFQYIALYERKRELYEKLHSGSLVRCGERYRSPSHRGDASKGKAGAAVMGGAAVKLRDRKHPKQIHMGLKRLSDEWDNFSSLVSTEEHDPSEEVIDLQLDKIRDMVNTDGLTPDAVMDALTQPEIL